MAHKVTVQPTIEPVSFAEAKTWLKVHTDVTEDDDLIRSLIKAARVWAESGTGQALMEQTIAQVWDYMPNYGTFELAVSPVISVTTVGYLDANGAYQTWASTNYTVDDISTPPRVVVKGSVSLPDTADATEYPNLWKITYKAGNTTTMAVDANIKTAMLLQIAMMYENREDMPLGRESGHPFARSAWNLLAISRVNLI